MPQLFERLEFFHVNKSCKIDRSGDKMHKIIPNMIPSWGLEFLKTKSVEKDNYLRLASFILEMGENVKLCSYYISMGAELHILFPLLTIKDADLR